MEWIYVPCGMDGHEVNLKFLQRTYLRRDMDNMDDMHLTCIELNRSVLYNIYGGGGGGGGGGIDNKLIQNANPPKYRNFG